MPNRVDFHQHYFTDFALEGLAASALSENGWIMPPENLPWTPALAVASMDRLGISTTILSLTGSPGGNGVGEANRAFARRLNLGMHQVVTKHPDRFGFFANIPIPSDTDAALAEIAFALDELNADGVNLTSSYGTGPKARYVADDSFDPVWEELNRRGTIVMLHGDQTPNSNHYPSPYLPLPVSEVPNETFKAAAHLVTSGKKRRFADVKIILTHAGGSTPVLASRVAVLSPHQGCELTPDEIIEDFRSFYYDTALAGFDVTLEALEALVPPGRIVFGSDFPAVSLDMANWYTQRCDEYFADRPGELEQVMRKNALALLPRLG